MFRKSLLFALALIMALSVVSCDSGKKLQSTLITLKSLWKNQKRIDPCLMTGQRRPIKVFSQI